MPSYLYQPVAIQRCDGNEIEDGECDIQETEIHPETDHHIHLIEEDIVERAAHDFRIDQDYENPYDRQYQVHCRAGKRYHELSLARMLIIQRIDLHRFSSSEMCDKDHEESDRIDMLKRIWGQSSL